MSVTVVYLKRPVMRLVRRIHLRNSLWRNLGQIAVPAPASTAAQTRPARKHTVAGHSHLVYE